MVSRRGPFVSRGCMTCLWLVCALSVLSGCVNATVMVFNDGDVVRLVRLRHDGIDRVYRVEPGAGGQVHRGENSKMVLDVLDTECAVLGSTGLGIVGEGIVVFDESGVPVIADAPTMASLAPVIADETPPRVDRCLAEPKP